ncbi:LptA/OstA family protein [Edaphobacter sp.]|uniref:LptA/OstA family protein n=1 Tax=Edaphobacter sp. TaxID=1934404 RepID=UPI002DBE5C51|nr:LptA/OstA family protein [Edaphobacter sp.]HEU5339654.1 LptA/OstA family protein [Edaphobacter sp.]
MGVSVSVERLRRWLLAGGGLLVAVIAAFLGVAHYRAHRFLTELPAKLGADIRQETNGFTYSQSDGRRTIYTIHASKAVEHKDGRYTLHDVGIVLYGRKSDRADRIYGSEFEYDQKEGVVRAMGEVHLDLQAPEAANASAKMDYAAGKDLEGGAHEADAAHMIHVTTSGLVYLQKLGVAATEQPIEFEAGGMKGQAVGADYTADTGVLVLHSAVKMEGVEQGQPAVLTATRAELDRDNRMATLLDARYVSTGRSGEESGQAARAVVHLRSDGTVERLDAEGAVTLKNADGGTMTAPRGVVVMNAKNEPQSVLLTGGLVYGADGPLRKAQGSAVEGRLGFDRDGKLTDAVLTGAVHLHEQVRGASTAGTPWNERALTAGAVELALDTDAHGKSRLRDAKATGGAVLALVDRSAKGAAKGVAKGKAAKKVQASGPVSSSLAGDVLTAKFVEQGGVNHLAEVHGDGHTSMRRVNAAGVVETSSADSLVAAFQPVGAEGKKSAKQEGAGRDEIASAMEQGHVVLTRQGVKKAGETAAPAEERVTAERASYDGALEMTTLVGNVQMSDADSVLWAERVVANQKTGDATAEGGVKVSYLQPKAAKGAASGSAAGSEEPVHVLAARADVKHAAETAIFYGTAGQRARLWQGASQVEAPVIELDKKQKKLVARGDGSGDAMAVRAVLTSAVRAEKAKVGAAAKDGSTAKAGAAEQRVFQVVSRGLVYSDQKREADFTGGVRVTSADGTMLGRQAEVYLQPVQAAGAKGKDAAKSAVGAISSGFMGGSVERMVASGGIVVEQPGRRATGEQVVYTASDGTFALTGTADVPPKVVDEERGTVTGTLIEFRAGDEGVVISNGGESGAGRVRTETRVKKRR